jgi:hypothetical protein
MEWILVAGTGWREGLPDAQERVSRAVGRLLAREEFGLVGGGWHGVDYVVAKAFAGELQLLDRRLSTSLLQVVPTGKEPQYRGGRVVYVPEGLQEFTGMIDNVRAAILIGGEGATYELYLNCLEERIPVFPVAGTGGDAARALADIQQTWARQPGGLRAVREEFALLSQPIADEESAGRLAEQLITLLRRAFQSQAPLPPTPERSIQHYDVFLSHNSVDRPIVERLNEALTARGLQTWFDQEELVAGRRWQSDLERIILTARTAAMIIGREGLGPWQERELGALLLQSVKRGMPLIPVLLPGAPRPEALPLFLQDSMAVDFRAGISQEALGQLELGIRTPVDAQVRQGGKLSGA